MFPVVMRIAILMAVLCAIYIALGRYMRWDRTRRLEDEYASGQGGALTREDYVAKGLAEYNRSWERKLLLGVFILPILAALVLALVANYG
ncbi:MAG: hypothetical protein ACE5EU_00525 [Paracoccaceae bacterium]